MTPIPPHSRYTVSTMSDPTRRADEGEDPGVGGPGIAIEERVSEKTQKPKMHVVYVHNDPFTPREFVVEVILRYFQKTTEEAVKIMERAHRQGMGAVGTYTAEIAETKVSVANTYARSQGRPLHFSTQEE